MDTKLILVDGLPGTGKSTFSQEISFQLRVKGIDAVWFHEVQKKNPLRPLGYLSESTGIDLIDISLSNWDKLHKNLRESENIYIIDGGLFQNTIRFFFHNELPQDAIYSYVNTIEKYISELGGVAFYLTHDDLATLWKNTVTNRGTAFSNIISHYIENTKFTKSKSYTDPEKVLNFWLHYESLCRSIFDELNIRKFNLNVTGCEWRDYYETACGHLGIVYQEISNAENDTVWNTIGRYIETDTGYSCEIRNSADQLLVTDILMPSEKESAMVKTIDCSEGMFNLRGSPVFIQLQPDLGVLKILTKDNWGGLNGKTLTKQNK